MARRISPYVSCPLLQQILKHAKRLFSTDMYDPPYLESLKPKIPLYQPLNIQIKGYDYVILENYQKEMHKIARILDLDVCDGDFRVFQEEGCGLVSFIKRATPQLNGPMLPESVQCGPCNVTNAEPDPSSQIWATPGAKHKIQKYKTLTTIVENEYFLTTYERNLQVLDMPSTTAPIFFELLEAGQPQGTQLVVQQHKEEHNLIRYVPDLELKGLKTQLTDLGGPLPLKKK